MASDYDWQVGDRVFAPWEEMWLYPATIVYIDRDDELGDAALVKYDDRDRAFLPIELLQSVAIRPGSLIFAKANPESLAYRPAVVLGVSDDGMRLRFTETNREGTVPLHDCRLLNFGPDLEEDEE